MYRQSPRDLRADHQPSHPPLVADFTLLSRFWLPCRLVTSRQTFVCRSHCGWSGRGNRIGAQGFLLRWLEALRSACAGRRKTRSASRIRASSLGTPCHPSIYRHAARLDGPRPFVDLSGDEFDKVFGASAIGRCNLLTNRFEAFMDERQIKGGAQRLIEVPDDQVRSVLR